MKILGRLVLVVLLFLVLIPALFIVACNGDSDDDDSDGALVDDDFDDDANEDCVDEDGDTYGEGCPNGTDCDDADGDVRQWLDGYTDGDGDGFGVGELQQICSGDSLPDGFVEEFGDCDDTDILVHPGALELPDDGIDQDCDGEDFARSDETGVFVATRGDDANPGTMTAPKRTINAGTNLAALAGKSVFVAAGDYTEDVKTKVSLFGGYESAAWTRDMDAYVTKINAEVSTAVQVGEEPAPGRGDDWDGDWRGTKADDATPVVIQGFAINGGSPPGEYGKSYGVLNYSTTIVTNNTIDGGSPTGDISSSHGVCNWEGTVTLVNNTISGGFQGDHISYGVYNWYGTMTLANNVISGGPGLITVGVDNYRGAATLSNNTIDGGSGSVFGVGVGNRYGTITLVNNVINGGSGSEFSHGVENYQSSTATLSNNTINGGSGYHSDGVRNADSTITLVNNTIDGGSGSRSRGVYNSRNLAAVTATLVNNNIWGANMDCKIYYYSYGNDSDECETNIIPGVNACGWSGCVESSGNISEDPLFVNPAGGDFHLQSGSPCIDTGINPVPDYIGPGLLDFDFEGDLRPYGTGWDIGADEWTP